MRRKILTVALLMIMSLGAHAQWVEQYNPGDELKGVKPGMRYFYTNDKVGMFQMAVPYPRQFMIAAQHPFQTDYVNGHDQCEVLIGLYTSGQLTERYTILMTSPRGYQGCLRVEEDATEEDKKKADKLISHLYHTGNSARIVAPLFGNGDFDLHIPSKSSK